ncbi:MAG: 50S ribosomal protein L35 [Christensenellales bacterium]|jgi:large subunit ribosomal protein L35|nr:50S ribosomal protein L35 [Christensenellaceae bacterium]HHU02188.1 50S ribosomal protein L35 [Christensenellaceae bacterium]
MPKMKSNRGAVKRFRVTKSGKVKHRKMNRNHILTKKNTKRQRQLRAGGMVANKKEARTIRTLIQQ